MQLGYSDPINHAFAFAAKHHDSELRKGLRATPYFTQPANVALILTRYGRDDITVLAGILHDLIASASREGRMDDPIRSEEHTSELQSRENLVCRLLLEKK